MLNFCFLFSLLISFVVNDGIIYRDKNNVTLKATEKAIVGEKYQFEGKYYLIVDEKILREKIKMDTVFSNLITTKVTDMSYLFYESKLQDPKIETWDVSNVKTMSWMFAFAEEIEPDLSHWDTQNVINFSDMFHGARKFNGNLSKWNTSSGRFFNGMFFESNFNSFINNWDMSSAKNLSGMFDDATYFNQPLDKWNTSNVEDMGGMFAEALRFNQDLSMWDVRKVKDMTNMFRNAANYRKNLSKWEIHSIKGIPGDFGTRSPVIPPKWNYIEEPWFTFKMIIPVILLISVFFILWKAKKKKPTLKNELNHALEKYLLEKQSNLITKSELDEILGITHKPVESQKKIRSNFVKEFNNSGLGKIYRVRDMKDSRSYNYEVQWEKK